MPILLETRGFRKLSSRNGEGQVTPSCQAIGDGASPRLISYERCFPDTDSSNVLALDHFGRAESWITGRKAGKKKKAVVAKVFTSKSGNTFLNIGAPMLPTSKAKKSKSPARIELYKGELEIRINAAF